MNVWCVTAVIFRMCVNVCVVVVLGVFHTVRENQLDIFHLENIDLVADVRSACYSIKLERKFNLEVINLCVYSVFVCT